jgi:hypothetical protein
MDYLKVDKKIPGQNYVCLSFVSPDDDIFEKKETYYFNKFLKSAAEKYKYDFNEMFKDYQDFKYKYAEKLQEDFSRLVNNKTNMQGIKVRGVFETIEEASGHAKHLRETDKYFHVFVGQVGYWLPFDPNPDMIKDQNYMEQQLNDLVRNYQENQIKAQQYFEERKQQMVEKAVKEGRQITQEEIDKGLDAIHIEDNVHPVEVSNIEN